MPTDIKNLEQRLWQAADNLRANSTLSSHEYSMPVLGLIFLRYAWHRFHPVHKTLKDKSTGRRSIGPDDYRAKNVLYLPEESRYNHLLELPEGEDIGQKVNEAMEAIEQENKELAGILPKEYKRFQNSVLKDLLKSFSNIPTDADGDVFGQIYEYFLGKFAMSEGQKGGEFFTPTAIVNLIVEVLEPYGGRILDPACGSGGMFVQSAKFRARHRELASENLSIYGQENKHATVRLCKMNLAVHGLEGEIKAGNTYYQNLHNCVGRFDYVMANPPFNVSGVDKEAIEDDPRYPFGIPRTDNANYLWMQEFYSALKDPDKRDQKENRSDPSAGSGSDQFQEQHRGGRAGFVMANSAADARHSEMDIRKQLIEEGAVDVIISIGSNFFYTVTLPCTLWFFDKGKQGSDRENKVLFIDARTIYRQIDRAHRDFTPEQIDFISRIVRCYRGFTADKSEQEQIDHAVAAEPSEEYKTSNAAVTQPDDMNELFTDGEYEDIPGLCKVATVGEIEEQGWSLNPGRYVGVAEREDDGVDFEVRLQELYEELELLNADANELESRISVNIQKILDK